MITVALITIGVVAILLAIQTPLAATEHGRLLVTVAVTLLVVTSPLADGMPVVDRLAAALVGGYGMHRILVAYLWPAPYMVLRLPPMALLVARPAAYTMRFQVARVAVLA